MSKVIMKFFVSLILYSNLSAQSFTISGVVKDPEGNNLPGVNAIISGLNIGDATSIKGEYRIKNIPQGKYIISFSILGYKKENRNINLTDDIILNIVLEPQPVISEQVIVTAGKHQQRLDELPVSAALIENRDLLRYNYSNLRDAMKYVSGLNLVDDQLSIRGSSGYSRGAGARVLVAIDGIPYYTGDTGEIIWEAVPVNEIERVEIIKGASSSLYGSTAIGGVVNLLTKEANEPFTYIKSYIGAYDRPSHELWDWSGEYRVFNGQTISHSNSLGDLNLSLSFTRLEDVGYRKNNFNKRYIGYIKTGYNFSESSSIKILFNSLNQRSGNFIYWKDSRNALVPPDQDLGQKVNSDRYMAGFISENQFGEKLTAYLRGSYYRTKWVDETASRNSSTADQYRGEIQTNYLFSNNLLLVSGFELNNNYVNSNLFGSPQSFGAGIYSQAELKFEFPLTASFGIRYDYNKVKNNEQNDALSPKFGLNYKLNENISLRTMLGTGFRAPSLAEKFTSTFVSGIQIKPNPLIQPESNVTFEAGLLLQNETFLLDAAVFRNGYYDMIETVIDPLDGQISFQNLVRARIQGFEFSLSPVISDFLDFNINYTFMDPRDLKTDKTLKYRPKHLLYTSLSFNYRGIETGLNFRYWSKVDEIDFELVELGLVPDGDKRVAVYVLDFNAGYNFLHSGFPGRVYINIKNLLNYNYVELIGNIAPIRNIAISFEFFL